MVPQARINRGDQSHHNGHHPPPAQCTFWAQSGHQRRFETSNVWQEVGSTIGLPPLKRTKAAVAKRVLLEKGQAVPHLSVMARARFQHWVKQLTAVLLVVIALQAVPAGAMAQVQDRGPAFSATSSEVSLAPRREVPAELRLTPVTPPPGPALVDVPSSAATPALPVWPYFNSRAPPHRWPLNRDRSPRGPPES